MDSGTLEWLLLNSALHLNYGQTQADKSDGYPQCSACLYIVIFVETNHRCLSTGCRQNAQGTAERAGHLARTVRPDAQAARHHRMGMIAAALTLLYIFLLNERTHGQWSLPCRFL